MMTAYPFEVISITEAGRCVEGRRSYLGPALALARRRWREYRGAARIEVRWEGSVVADDPSDFILSSSLYHTGHMRKIPR